MMLSTTVQAQGKPTTALELSNSYSSATDTLYMKGTQWGEALTTAAKAGDYTVLKPVRMGMQQFIERKTKEIAASPTIGGSEQFKAVMLRFMAYEKDMITTTFIPFEKLTASSTKEDFSVLIDKTTANSKGEDVLIKEIGEVQKAYAKKNDFTIEEPAAPK